ncbi:cobalamin biosynthesis protein CbiX [Mycobacterium sp. MS1601]|uniref:sirohydrochlorin chelatase n=1 Tax=Mycobacterium sp. MS1601 TaxID=1936029 RepID=UPI0009795159|nr:sirohydrochlorin chelatase [Mycobacterium sp. MS1601]AQA03589.1 cobalamin biosynthesis protein CbiX [Mycobacterium sp. MS1601]
MNPILVAHGTRKAAGVDMIGELADRVSSQLGQRVRVAFVDVLGPTPAEVLRTVDGPAILVPAFLSAGYHVRRDIPEHVEASGHSDVRVTKALGPCPQMVRVVTDRLVESGWRHGDSVIMAAAGTSDPHAQHDLRVTATLLSAALGSRVELAYAATGEPRVADAVATLRERGARRVVVASYLLADGLFQDRLRDSGADVVSEPLGLHLGTVRLIANRFRRAQVSGDVWSLSGAHHR